jgi:hypothetical protein
MRTPKDGEHGHQRATAAQPQGQSDRLQTTRLSRSDKICDRPFLSREETVTRVIQEHMGSQTTNQTSDLAPRVMGLLPGPLRLSGQLEVERFLDRRMAHDNHFVAALINSKQGRAFALGLRSNTISTLERLGVDLLRAEKLVLLRLASWHADVLDHHAVRVFQGESRFRLVQVVAPGTGMKSAESVCGSLT